MNNETVIKKVNKKAVILLSLFYAIIIIAVMGHLWGYYISKIETNLYGLVFFSVIAFWSINRQQRSYFKRMQPNHSKKELFYMWVKDFFTFGYMYKNVNSEELVSPSSLSLSVGKQIKISFLDFIKTMVTVFILANVVVYFLLIVENSTSGEWKYVSLLGYLISFGIFLAVFFGMMILFSLYNLIDMNRNDSVVYGFLKNYVNYIFVILLSVFMFSNVIFKSSVVFSSKTRDFKEVLKETDDSFFIFREEQRPFSKGLEKIKNDFKDIDFIENYYISGYFFQTKPDNLVLLEGTLDVKSNEVLITKRHKEQLIEAGVKENEILDYVLEVSYISGHEGYKVKGIVENPAQIQLESLDDILVYTVQDKDILKRESLWVTLITPITDETINKIFNKEILDKYYISTRTNSVNGLYERLSQDPENYHQARIANIISLFMVIGLIIEPMFRDESFISKDKTKKEISRNIMISSIFTGAILVIGLMISLPLASDILIHYKVSQSFLADTKVYLNVLVPGLVTFVAILIGSYTASYLTITSKNK